MTSGAMDASAVTPSERSPGWRSERPARVWAVRARGRGESDALAAHAAASETLAPRDGQPRFGGRELDLLDQFHDLAVLHLARDGRDRPDDVHVLEPVVAVELDLRAFGERVRARSRCPRGRGSASAAPRSRPTGCPFIAMPASAPSGPAESFTRTGGTCWSSGRGGRRPHRAACGCRSRPRAPPTLSVHMKNDINWNTTSIIGVMSIGDLVAQR